MIKKICYSMIFSFVAISNFLVEAIEYDIQDIGTLQTHSSQAIAINNQGQILGWYNIDGSTNGKHFFVRDREGAFHEIIEDFSAVYLNVPQELYSVRIDWRYLTDDGRAYGTFNWPNDNPILFMWDLHNGLVKLGRLPGKEISAINNSGQVLIKSIEENENGKSVRHPVIWQNGQIIKLKGLGGDLGIESGKAYGFGMNNNGDVIGQSEILLNYKNNIYKQVHATMWIDGQPIDLHDKMPKSLETIATAITDLREVLIEGHMLCQDGSLFNIGRGSFCNKMTSNYICYKNCGIFDVLNRCGVGIPSMANKANSIWLQCIEICSVNDKGEAIAKGKTIYGEEHAMLLTPVKSN